MNNIYKIFLFIILIIPNISCSNRLAPNVNQVFLNQYGDRLSGMKKRISDNNANVGKVDSTMYNNRISLNPRRYRFGDYDRNARIFSPLYLEYNFPNSYPVKRVNFNDIDIPNRDIFDIKTEMRKAYPVIDSQELQSNIRQVK